MKIVFYYEVYKDITFISPFTILNSLTKILKYYLFIYKVWDLLNGLRNYLIVSKNQNQKQKKSCKQKRMLELN